MIYSYSCGVCQRDFDQIKSIVERNDVFCCGKRAFKHICMNPQINDDLMYRFEGEFRGVKKEIHSKNQYKRVLKEKGLVDVTIPEVKSVREKQTKKQGKHDLKKLEHRIKDRVARDGLSKHLNPLLEKCTNQ